MFGTDRRFQVFVSSTFEDMREERQQVTQAILELGCFPSGMELFPASDMSAWRLIQNVIQECDYYVIVAGGKYGSLGPNGKSFTEMEFDFAVEVGIPILGFVQRLSGDTPAKKLDESLERRALQEAFRNKIKARSSVMFNSPSELGMAVMKSLVAEMRVNPRIGWVRADKARSDEDRDRELELVEKLSMSEDRVRVLERQLRDSRLLTNEIKAADLAQGADIFTFDVRFRSAEKKMVLRHVELSWDEIFMAIGSTLYGYIMRRSTPSFGSPKQRYSFEESLEEVIRQKILNEIADRKMHTRPDQIDACIVQFKELGYMEYKEKEEEDGSTFRGITLTESGERHLALITARKRPA